MIFLLTISRGIVKPLQIEKGLAVVALIGDQMKNHQGISGSMFNALGKNNVNIRAITQGASENNISTVIAEKDVKKALNVLHAAFLKIKSKNFTYLLSGWVMLVENLYNRLNNKLPILKKIFNLELKYVVCLTLENDLNPEGINSLIGKIN